MKFDTLVNLRAWQDSGDRQSLMREATEFLAAPWDQDMELKYGSVVPVAVAVDGDASAGPAAPPSMLKITFLLHINVRVPRGDVLVLPPRCR